MEFNLLELKRYAINKRVEIEFGDSEHRYMINSKGLVKVLSADKTAPVENVLKEAQSFEITGQGKPQRLSREQMAQSVGEALKGHGAVAAAHDED